MVMLFGTLVFLVDGEVSLQLFDEIFHSWTVQTADLAMYNTRILS